MKHSKMFKMLLTGVAIAALASSTFAAMAVPFADSFESYADGTDIGTDNSGWYAEEEVAMATTNKNPTGYHGGYPITNASHNGSMSFDGTVSNAIAGVDEEGVYVDFLVQPTFWDEEDTPVVPRDSQVALYFDTNGYANIYHTYEQLFDPYEALPRWTKIDNVGAIGTSDWVRVTYQLFYDNPDFTYFKLWINGKPASSAYGYIEDDFNATNGVYFINADCMGLGAPGETKINSFTAKGAGVLDDFVITNGEISPFEAPADERTVTAVAGIGGSIDPAGDTLVNAGDTFTATVTADMNYLIESIKYFENSSATTNSVVVTDGAVQVVNIENILNDMTVEATFTNSPITYYTIAITNLNETLGTIVPGTDEVVAAGSDLTVVATPNTGYAAEFTIDGSSAMDAVLTDIQEDHVVLVNFVLGNVPSSNGVYIASTWLIEYGLDLTDENADMYWGAYLADINPLTGSFEIISAEVEDGTNYIKWISEGKTADLPPFTVLGTDDLTAGWSPVDIVARPSTFTTNVFMDATKTFYKVHAADIE